MKYLVLLTLGFAVLAAAPASAQQQPSGHEQLKQLEWVVGDWATEVKALKDVPGLLKKGDPVTMKLSVRWILDKNALENTLSSAAAGKTLAKSHGLIGWDPGKKTILSGGFTTRGGFAMSSWSESDGGWRIQAQGAEADGTKFSETLLLSDITDDSFVSQVVNRREGDQELPDTPKTTWKRTKRQSD